MSNNAPASSHPGPDESRDDASTDLRRELRNERNRSDELKLQLSAALGELREARQTIVKMQSGAFWELRMAVVRGKRLLRSILPGALRSPAPRTPSSSKAAESTTAPRTGDRSGSGDLKQDFANLYLTELKTFLASGETLSLPKSTSSPRVSILIVVYNRAELTFKCLQSLIAQGYPECEVIIVDNASSDTTADLLRRVENVRVVRNTRNNHFLLGCNQAARIAVGRHLLFLNNDTQLLPGAIESAVNTLESAPDIGAVGGRIIHMDGTLQEAGSIVYRDGSCDGYGRGKYPLAPEYMFQRDVDYCSGAFLVTGREDFLGLGLFDDELAPAYYEETDYCWRLRLAGKRVVYDPGASLLHFEFASSEMSETAHELQAQNRAKFVAKHASSLASKTSIENRNALVDRFAYPAGHRILVIEDRVPHPRLGSGYPRSLTIVQALSEPGNAVTFYPTLFYNEEWDSVYSTLPRNIEAMTGHGADGLEAFLNDRVGYYDAVLVSRPHNMRTLAAVVDRHPDWFARTRVVYDAECIFAERELMRRQRFGTGPADDGVVYNVRGELELAATADVVLCVSPRDRSKFVDAGCKSVMVLGHSMQPAPTQQGFEDRRGLLFVGALKNAGNPNEDSMTWFASQILPLIRSRVGDDALLEIVGTVQLEEILDLAGSAVHLAGTVADVTPFYNNARVFVAPTRFAGGIPHKVHEAAAGGVPVVATSLIAEQLGWTAGHEILIGDTPEEFAAQCIALLTDRDLWNRIRTNALAKIAVDCSPTTFAQTLAYAIS